MHFFDRVVYILPLKLSSAFFLTMQFHGFLKFATKFLDRKYSIIAYVFCTSDTFS